MGEKEEEEEEEEDEEEEKAEEEIEKEEEEDEEEERCCQQEALRCIAEGLEEKWNLGDQQDAWITHAAGQIRAMLRHVYMAVGQRTDEGSDNTSTMRNRRRTVSRYRSSDDRSFDNEGPLGVGTALAVV
eukprot:8763537-Pyramimonas_sp.AAC.1